MAIVMFGMITFEVMVLRLYTWDERTMKQLQWQMQSLQNWRIWFFPNFF